MHYVVNNTTEAVEPSKWYIRKVLVFENSLTGNWYVDKVMV